MNIRLLQQTITISLLAGMPTVTAAGSELQLTGDITVSGLSSGGYMAVQFHLAFSDRVNGAAVIAGGPLYCAQNSLATAFADCMGKADAKPDLTAIEHYLDNLEQQQMLASRQNLLDDKVWILHGSQDATVHPNVGKALHQQYLQWIPADSIEFVADKPFAHHFPTDRTTETACDISEPPFIASCNYDAAGELLKHLLGTLNPKVDATTGSIRQLTQSQAGSQLAATGYVYVPEQCATGEPCRLHISFHGCKQHAAAVDDAYITQTGLNHYADSNDLVVLYPQAAASAFNPHGCWDWWGYTGERYITNQAPQLQAVMLIAEQLSAKN